MHKKILIYLCFLLVPLYHFPEVFLSNFQFGHPDHLGFLIPIKSFFFSNLKNHNITWFYPYHLMGVPLSLGPHYQIFFPTNLFWLVFDDPNLCYKLQYFSSYFLFQTFLFHFLKSLTHSSILSLLSTLLLASCPLVWSTHLRPLELDSLSFVPFSLWMSIKFLKKQKNFFAFLSGIAIFVIYLSGDPTTCLFTFAFNLALYATISTAKESLLSTSTHIKKKISGFLLTSLTATILITPLFLKSLTWLSLTERNEAFSFQEKFLYSSHPVRLLEILSPVGNLFWQQDLLNYANPAWWYESICFGSLCIAIMIFGFVYPKSKFKNLSMIFLAVILITIFISYGKEFSFSNYIWSHVPPFNFMRFPERILKHCIIPIGICLAIGLQAVSIYLNNYSYKLKQKSAKILTVLCLFVFLEVQLALPNQNNTKPQMIQEYPEEFPNLGISDRIHICKNNVGSFNSQQELFTLMEPRMWRIPQLIASEASFPLPAKKIDCDPMSLDPKYYEQLGITHILTPWFETSISHEIEKQFQLKKINENQKLNYIIFRTSVEKSFQAIRYQRFSIGGIQILNTNPRTTVVDPYWYINEQGHIKKTEEIVKELKMYQHSIGNCVDLAPERIITNQSNFLNKITIQYHSSCPSLLSIPITFAPGWRASNNSKEAKIFRINQWNLGVFTKEGTNSIELYYEKP